MVGPLRLVTFADVARAATKIAPHLSRTPLLTCRWLDELAGCELFLKCENLQETGSFKARGALNAVLSLPELRTVGITAHSLGNHAAAVAFAARTRNLPCTVVIPHTAPASKIENTRSYGATVLLCEPGTTNREAAARKVAEEKGYHIVPPYDDAHVIAGQGTLALEMIEQLAELQPDCLPLDAILVPISGGGMAAGVAIATRALSPSTRVIAVEPMGKQLGTSLAAGKPLWPAGLLPLATVADGCRTSALGKVTWPICLEMLDQTGVLENSCRISTKTHRKIELATLPATARENRSKNR
ncbi:tryptophan synthase beta subunit-like PLP-dependent enzyme [Pavlovales sp. CCMP2436]|nr:tryptophan synthase beta subunit-like PLP-dependent enzyme [Pavlovales sp. CCMP2436]